MIRTLKIEVHTHMTPTSDELKEIIYLIQSKVKVLEYANKPSHNTIQKVFVKRIDE